MRKNIIPALIALFFTAVPWAWAEQTVMRRAAGVVTATNTEAAPNTIVIKSKTWKGKDLVIGASIDDKTVIENGGKRSSLKEIKAGDRVEMTYERNSGLKARSISVRK